METQLNTISQLLDYGLTAWDKKGQIVISSGTLAQLCTYAVAVGVQAGHNQHSKQMNEIRHKALSLRYYRMAESILPKSDYLYDPRYSETEFGDFEADVVVRKVANA